MHILGWQDSFCQFHIFCEVLTTPSSERDEIMYLPIFGIKHLHLLSIFPGSTPALLTDPADPSDPLQSTYIQSGAEQCWKYFVTEVTLKNWSMITKIIERAPWFQCHQIEQVCSFMTKDW